MRTLGPHRPKVIRVLGYDSCTIMPDGNTLYQQRTRNPVLEPVKGASPGLATRLRPLRHGRVPYEALRPGSGMGPRVGTACQGGAEAVEPLTSGGPGFRLPYHVFRVVHGTAGTLAAASARGGIDPAWLPPAHMFATASRPTIATDRRVLHPLAYCQRGLRARLWFPGIGGVPRRRPAVTARFLTRRSAALGLRGRHGRAGGARRADALLAWANDLAVAAAVLAAAFSQGCGGCLCARRDHAPGASPDAAAQPATECRTRLPERPKLRRRMGAFTEVSA